MKNKLRLLVALLLAVIALVLLFVNETRGDDEKLLIDGQEYLITDITGRERFNNIWDIRNYIRAHDPNNIVEQAASDNVSIGYGVLIDARDGRAHGVIYGTTHSGRIYRITRDGAVTNFWGISFSY